MVETDELKAITKKLEHAIIRAHTLSITYKSAERELKLMREARVPDASGKLPKPSNLESATAKGLWGSKEYRAAADKEVDEQYHQFIEYVVAQTIDQYKAELKARRARTVGTVVVEAVPVVKKKRINKKL